MAPEPSRVSSVHLLPRFCAQCGAGLKEKFVPAENHDRLVCENCGGIAYLNPKIVAGTIPLRDGKLLLLRRGIEPQKGKWTFPAGFVELWETVAEAAARETREETGVLVRPGKILGLYSYNDSGVVTVVYCAEVTGGRMQTSEETEEVAVFRPEEIPWGDLAFRSTHEALRDWVDLHAGKR